MDDLLLYRLSNQQLEQPRFESIPQIVEWMGAMQSQDFAGAKWALGLRLPGLTEPQVEQAYNDGVILRTHLMRPTWHFVTPADIRWILDLTAKRVQAVDSHYWRELDLSPALFEKANLALTDALRGGKQLIREELSEALAQAGIEAQGRRLGHILMHAELDQVICSGPRRGKQFTYMLFDERVPRVAAKPREEGLLELTRRYFTSHGPATVHDYSWWSGLTVTDVKAALNQLNAEFDSFEMDGKTYWQSRLQSTSPKAAHRAFLLPPFDEYTVAYPDHSLIKDPRAAEPPVRPVFSGSVIIDCRLAGYWRRVFSGKSAIIEMAPLRDYSAEERHALEAEAQRYADFMEMPVEIKMP